MSRKGVKMGLSDFLSTADSNSRGGGSNINLDALPKGPRARADDDDGGYRGGRGGERREREPMRSEGSDRWRGDRSSAGGSSFRGGDDSYRGGPSSFRGREERYEERPAHLRLNLSRRGEDGPSGGSSFRSEPRRDDDDKFSRAFSRGGDSGRFGDRDSGRFGDRDGGRFGDRDGGRFGGDRYGDRDSSRFGDRYGDRDGGRFAGDRFGSRPESSRFGGDRDVDRMTSSFERQTVSEPREDPAEAARKKKEEEKAARAAEKAAAKAKAEEAAAKAKAEKLAAAEAEAAAAAKAADVMTAILATEKKGEALVAAAKPLLKGTELVPAVVMAALLKHNQFTATSSVKWMTPDEYGAFMAHVISATSTKAQLKALYALQLFMHENRGLDGKKTKGMMETCFKALYAFDVIGEEAFIEYKYDTEDNTPGKMQAFIETTEWLSWLETNDDDDEEDEDEDEY
ncbi:putative cleavage-induced protein [Achlya hypogyna]|uniref:Putative cleavage-induced protein n=1 Tax=Achlya hypogyna TaxID=1202772 RepID=A0A1V9ZBE5_ACHHY|nr:putative cleavage-induced protein [Achlya hypogyna]